MSEKREVKADFTKLNAFVKVMGDNKNVVRVGIFGNKKNREKGKQTNPELGAIHEFGMASRGIPPRSFLRMPIKLKTDDILANASKGILPMLAAGNMIGVLKRLGIAAENVVQEAFATRGFGAWKPNAPATIKRKGSDSPLIDTRQLRASIASVVVKAA